MASGLSSYNQALFRFIIVRFLHEIEKILEVHIII